MNPRDGVNRLHDFESCAFNHSATSPCSIYCIRRNSRGQLELEAFANTIDKVWMDFFHWQDCAEEIDDLFALFFVDKGRNRQAETFDWDNDELPQGTVASHAKGAEFAECVFATVNDQAIGR